MLLSFMLFIYCLLSVGNLATAATTTSPSTSLETDSSVGEYAVFAIPRNETEINSLWWQLFYRNSSAFIGDIKYDRQSEPLILTLAISPGERGLVFTSFHTVPTGWQSMYIYPNASRPVSFTIPHGGFISPSGSPDPNGFTVRRGLDPRGQDGYLIRYKNSNRWHACPVNSLPDFDGKPSTYRIFYVGGANKAPNSCVPVALVIERYGFCDRKS